MEASTTVRGGRRHEEATTFVAAGTSKRINDDDLGGHNSCSRPAGGEHMDMEPAASAVRGGQRRPKRPLELRLYQDDYDSEDEDDYEVREATFVVVPGSSGDGAYTNFEMPKRINLGYDVGETSALLRTHQAEDERGVAVDVRLAAMVRDVYIRLGRPPPPPPTLQQQ